MMLQTSLHSPQVEEKERMDLQSFMGLAKTLNGDKGFTERFLEEIYKSVKKTQLGFHVKAK